MDKPHETPMYSEDRLGKLPEDILVMILSLLTLKEAAKTGVLSRSWINLWTYSTGNLEFVASDGMRAREVEEVRKLVGVGIHSFVDCVNKVLQKHNGPVIDTFSIRFDLDAQSGVTIDSWINFALRKRVKKLQLDITDVIASINYYYTLPIQILRNHCLDCLCILHLSYVRVSGEVLEYILSNSPSLEVLSVECSRTLVSLKVPGPFLKLRDLSIIFCWDMQSMDVSGIKICSLKYWGPKIRLSVKDVPCLVNADIGGAFASFVVENIYHFSSYLAQLEMFALNFNRQIRQSLPRFPIMQNLKELELFLIMHRVVSLLFCTSLFEACPVMHRFVLKMGYIGWKCTAEIAGLEGWRKVEWNVHCGHKSLKLVEIVGFVGFKVDFDFAHFILTNIASLEKLIIVPEEERYVNKSEIRTRARLLESVVPEGAELVIL